MEESTNATSPISTRSVGIRYGLFLGVISIAYFMIMNLLGVDMSQGFGRWGGLVFSLAMIFLAHKYFKDNGDGFMSFGQGFGIGFWISLISSAISSVFTYIYVSFIDQSFIQQMLDKVREGMEQKGTPDDQIEKAMEITAKFMTPGSMFIFGIIGGVIMGIICAVVVTLFTQKKSPEAFV
jgi:hypothetical protein